MDHSGGNTVTEQLGQMVIVFNCLWTWITKLREMIPSKIGDDGNSGDPLSFSKTEQLYILVLHLLDYFLIHIFQQSVIQQVVLPVDLILNFGQKPFKFHHQMVSTINTANTRPETVISRPDQYVGVTTYDGNNSTSNLFHGHKTDMVWCKSKEIWLQ